MEVPDLADSWQLWLSDPSLAAESTFSANMKNDTRGGKQVGRKDVREERLRAESGMLVSSRKGLSTSVEQYIQLRTAPRLQHL